MADQRATTPTTEDLLKLPRWARVVYAARATRRSLLAFAPKPYAIEGLIQNPLPLIQLCEASARVARSSPILKSRRFAKYADVIRVAGVVRSSESASRFWPKITGNLSAKFLTDVAKGPTKHDAEAAHNAAQTASAEHATESWYDYYQLLALSDSESWTDVTPVDADRLGPLWPLGTHTRHTKTWPRKQKSSPSPVLQLDIVVPSGMTPKQSRDFNERVAKFHAALSGLHAAMGGTGLRFLDEGSCEMVPAEDEAPFTSGSPAPFALSSTVLSAACSGDPL